jgi:hypothetical protein
MAKNQDESVRIFEVRFGPFLVWKKVRKAVASPEAGAQNFLI